MGAEGTRFAAVRALFEGALDLPPAERRAFIEREASDAGARVEALDLLQELDQDGAELHPPDIGRLARSFEREGELPEVGARIAGYEILRTIGEGGMGRVFEAREISPPRRVALKMMRSGLGTAASQRRFEVEAEVLARLLHPGVAQVYASGLWVDERHPDVAPRPWFAMEFVPEARSFLDHARSRTQGLGPRLELFLELCDAVEHAHQRGVIHRDLKAANVLVDGDGRVKVIDFGIARVDGAQGHGGETIEGEVLGTLATMSPEQALGRWSEVDVRTDVYALGVLLYELAAGCAPYDLAGLSVPSAVRTVCEDPPMRPGAHGLTRTGDLDWVVLRALEKDRNRRYANVTELAADVRRFMDHEPVVAGPPTWRYRTTKYLRRHRLVVTAGILVLVSLVGGLVVATLERGRAVASAETSRRAADHAAFINRFLLDTLAAPDPWIAGPDVRVRDRLDSALDGIRADLSDQPELRASLLAALGKTYSGLSMYERSEEVLSEAIALMEEQHGPTHRPTLEARADRVDVLLGLALFGEAASEALAVDALASEVLDEADGLRFALRDDWIQAASGMGELDAALTSARALVADSEAAFGPDAEETVSARRTLAAVHSERGEVLESEELARACLASLVRSLPADHPDVLRATRAVATQLLSRRSYDEAETLLDQTLELSRARFGEQHNSTIATRVDLAVLHLHRRNLDQAASLATDALAQARARLQSDHPLLHLAVSVRAEVAILQGHHGDAETLFMELVEARRRLLPAVHPLRAETENGFAALLYESGRWDEAEAAYRRAIEAAPSESRFIILSASHGLGVSLLSQGRAVEAAEVLEACLAGRVELSGPENDSVLDTRTMLSRAYLERGDLVLARQMADVAVAGRLVLHGPEALKTAEALNNLAVVQQSQGQYVAAEEAMREVLVIFGRILGHGHPSTVRAWNNLGLSLHYQDRVEEALDVYLTGLSFGSEQLGEGHPAVSRISMNLAELQMRMGSHEDGLMLFDALIDGERERGSPGSTTSRYAMSGRGRALRGLGRDDEADMQVEDTWRVLKEVLGPSHWESLRAALDFIRMQRTRGAIVEAAEVAAEASDLAHEVQPRAEDLFPLIALEAGEMLLELGSEAEAAKHLARARDTWASNGKGQPSQLARVERGLAHIATGADAAE